MFEPKKKNLFEKLQSKIEDVILMRPEVDEEMMEDLEEALITSDIARSSSRVRFCFSMLSISRIMA